MLRALGKSRNPLFWRRVFVAPACLCAVACLHLYRVSACRQTPWKRGGFGMFSTVNSEDSRFLRCRKGEAGEAIAIPKFLAQEELRTRVAPTPQRLSRLASLLTASEKTPVVVELWRYHFDSASGKLVAEKRDEARGAP